MFDGEGAAWISAECEEDLDCVYQLDLFHIYSKASKKVKDKDIRKELHRLIKESKWEELIERTKELWENASEEEKKNMWELYSYYSNNREALKRYWEVLPREILRKIPNDEIREIRVFRVNCRK